MKYFPIGMIAVGLLCMFLIGCGAEQPTKSKRAAPTYPTEQPTNEAPITAPVRNIASQKHTNTSTPGGAGLGTYSIGYRVGQITKYSVKGLAFKSGEGQMLMGRESTPYTISYSCGDGDTCRKTINPWYFSTAAKDGRLMKPYAGEYAWVKYTQAAMKSPAFSTDYIINQLGNIDRTSPIKTCVDKGASGAKSEGVRVGRIVKVSMKGHVSKTGELMMQVGNAGNQFKNMSLTGAMFDCAVNVLKSAKKVKIHYAQSWFVNPFASDTTYAVSKIELIQDI